MKRLRYSALIAAGIAAIAFIKAPMISAPLDTVSVNGNCFVLPNGNSIIFKGLALAEPALLTHSGMWNKEYFAQAAKWNANIVRIPVSPSKWRELGKTKYLKILDKGVHWAEQHDLYVVIDWHSIGNLKDEKFQRPSGTTTYDETLDFWRTISTHYSGNSTVAIYEIFNEPTDFFGKLGELSWDDWRRMTTAIVEEIRKHDTETIPAIAGLKWGYDLTEAREKPFDIDGIAYSIHPYPMKSKEPWEESWEQTWGFIADTYPMIALEFGYMNENDKGAHIPCITTDDARFGERIIDYFNTKGISWTAWCFYPDWTPSLIDGDYNPTPGQGKFFHNVLTKRD